MKRNVLEYAATDKFILLALTSNNPELGKGDGLINITREQFDPDILEELTATSTDDYGIPDCITISGIKFNMDELLRFHGSVIDNQKDEEVPETSFSCDRITMTWFSKDKDAQGRPLKHREDGPALVEMKQFSTEHTHGDRRGFSIGNWRFGWYMNGRLERHAGPHSLHGDSIQAAVFPDGSFRTVQDAKRIRVRFGWNSPNGENITDVRKEKCVARNKIVVNELALGASVFPDEMEQAIFYSTVFED